MSGCGRGHSQNRKHVPCETWCVYTGGPLGLSTQPTCSPPPANRWATWPPDCGCGSLMADSRIFSAEKAQSPKCRTRSADQPQLCETKPRKGRQVSSCSDDLEWVRRGRGPLRVETHSSLVVSRLPNFFVRALCRAGSRRESDADSGVARDGYAEGHENSARVESTQAPCVVK